jgi:hypothetical protein
MKNRKSISIGLVGGLGLLALYFLLLTLANSFRHAVEQFAAQWYWLILLSLGFGVQLGLYSFIRFELRKRAKGATAGLVASGGISTGSMIACCAHHFVDVLPIIGLSAAAVFLTRYQAPFILVGIFTNLVGISVM